MHYINHLSLDDQLSPLIEKHKVPRLKKQKNICLYLCYSIMSQQLSTKVAQVFHQRFIDLYGGKEPTPAMIAATPFATLRRIGLSNAKAQYVLNVAAFELNHGMSLSKLSVMTDAEVIEYLTQIKGVGRWTVEMLLMFALGREDVFSADDLGIQTAMKQLYRIRLKDKKQTRKKMERIAAAWSPYRTYACLYLWRWKDIS